MSRASRLSPEVRERAVRLVFEQRSKQPSQWTAVVSVAGKIGCTAQTLQSRIHQAEGEASQRAGAAPSEAERIRALARENRELKRANEILKTASAFFAQGALDRRLK